MIDKHLKHLTEHYEQLDKKAAFEKKLAIATLGFAVLTVALFAVALFIPYPS